VSLDVLARLSAAGPGAPVVSVYLNTRWADEHQRERTRVFLKNEIRKARATADPELLEDLAWIEAQGQRLVEQADHPDAHGAALFASAARQLREMVPVRVPFEDAFVVGPSPVIGPLADLAGEAPALVVFVDGERARLIGVGPEGRGEEVVLEHEVMGRHRRGGWALLAQSRYQRHLAVHRGQHFDAVAAAVAHVAEEAGVRRLVLAGEARTLAAFRQHLPAALASAVVGSVSGTRYEQAATLVDRAVELLCQLDRERQARTIEALLVEAAKGGRAVAGVESTLKAVARGAVHRLYLLPTCDVAAAVCEACGALKAGASTRCRECGGPARAVRIADAVVERVIAAGGSVELVEASPALEQVDGLAARLRYPA
jgi:hypothetical protein